MFRGILLRAVPAFFCVLRTVELGANSGSASLRQEARQRTASVDEDVQK
jgi:hypothetical protein